MLQKIENAYLAILRVVIILIAGLLLAGVGFYGLNSFKGFAEPKPDTQPPQVSGEDITHKMTASPAGQKSPEGESEQAAPQPAVDANQPHYARAAGFIISFVAKQSNNGEVLDKSGIEKFIKEHADAQPTPELVTAFAKGFADAIEATLTTPSVALLASQSSAIAVVSNALDAYTEVFNQQVEDKEANYIAAQQKHQEDKAEAMQSLYIAAGAFGAFLLIIFLSIFIRIERNLRHLEGKTLVYANALKP